jgi:pimeloyl-ACP methyl ester carboxylesterase
VVDPSVKARLVLLCGLLCDRFVWEAVAEHLQDVADVSTLSFAGCRSIEEMAEQVLTRSAETFALAGHSMGGRVALEVVRMAPHRVLRLAMLNTGVHPVRDSEVPGRQRLLNIARTAGMPAVADEWLPSMVGADARQDGVLMEGLRAMVQRHSAEEFSGQIHALLNRPDAEAVLSLVKVPTLLLSSDEDQWSPISQHEQIRSQVPGSRLVALEGVGHMTPVEAPQAVAEAIRSWLIEEAIPAA